MKITGANTSLTANLGSIKIICMVQSIQEINTASTALWQPLDNARQTLPIPSVNEISTKCFYKTKDKSQSIWYPQVTASQYHIISYQTLFQYHTSKQEHKNTHMILRT